ncbi:unnamed protein product [Prunus brigantina]
MAKLFGVAISALLFVILLLGLAYSQAETHALITESKEVNVAVTSEYGCRKIKCHWDKQRSSRILSAGRDEDDPRETPSNSGAPYGPRP